MLLMADNLMVAGVITGGFTTRERIRRTQPCLRWLAAVGPAGVSPPETDSRSLRVGVARS
jgi:hypothetical protein